MTQSTVSVTSLRQRWLDFQRHSTSSPDITVGVAASFTAEPLEPFLGASLLDHGFVPAITFAQYDQIHQVCSDPDSTMGTVDLLVLLWRIEDMFSRDFWDAVDGGDRATTRLVGGLEQLGRGVGELAARVSYPVFVSYPPVPSGPGIDELDSRLGVRATRLHGIAMEAFMAGVAEAPVRMVDLNGWVCQFGAMNANDAAKAFMYRQPYVTAFLGMIGRNLADCIARETKPIPKCIVVDCDNTLWGGVIAEDGIGGIALGSTFPGSAFQEFQRVLKRLNRAGVLLALNSKNDHSEVLAAFTQHDEMLLSTADIAVWRVNWQLKSQNIREIAVELNISEDSLVFIDDSSHELAEVRAALPHVRTLQVPEELELLPDLIPESGLFRNMHVSQEDRVRTEMVSTEGYRREVASTLTKEEFLASLELEVEFFAVGEQHVTRVAQLTNKTNQFNLTTIRRTEAEIRALLNESDHNVYAIRVSDKFGDYGLVGVAVVGHFGARWEVDTFLMSCRVLGRGIETAFLARVVSEAVAGGAGAVTARYVATPKNGLVEDFYLRHGFIQVGDGEFEANPIDVTSAPGHIAFR